MDDSRVGRAESRAALSRPARKAGGFGRAAALWLLSASIGIGVAAGVRADEIVLKGGGRLQGKISPDPNDADRVQLWLLNSKNPLSFRKTQILESNPKPSPLDDYVVKREQTPADAQAHYDLGLWCEQNQLPDLARRHYETAAELDPSFAPAREKLGHVFLEGRWLTADELRGVQGLVKFKGRWITAEEKTQIENGRKAVDARTSWLRRLRPMRQALIDGSNDQRREAEMRLLRIRDPAAVEPLIRVFGGDAAASRKLLIQILGGIPGPEAAEALVSRLLVEDDPDVRYAALEQLQPRKEAVVETGLIRALRFTDGAVVNRAAWTIRHLNLVAAVPHLIPALVVGGRRASWIRPNAGLAPAVGPGFGFAGGPTPFPPYYVPGGALMAANANSFAVLTPPAVGPGAVAYGAYVVTVNDVFNGPGFMTSTPTGFIGLGAPGPGFAAAGAGGPVLRSFPAPIENLEVHDALVALTNRDFEYDVAAWTNWLRREFKPNPIPTRRVPQP